MVNRNKIIRVHSIGVYRIYLRASRTIMTRRLMEGLVQQDPLSEEEGKHGELEMSEQIL